MFDLLQWRGGVIVSVQASGGEPLNTPEYLGVMAESVLDGGACGLRMAQPENIRHFKQRHPGIPVIGITKPDPIPHDSLDQVFITPGWGDVCALAEAGCEVVALDATQRPRPDGETLGGIVERARRDYPHLKLMADIATLKEALNANHLGFDLISTTLSGYTRETVALAADGPDFELVRQLMARATCPVIVEGRLWAPEEVTQAFALGAFAVVIGSAITRPHHITRRFVEAARAAN